MVIDKIVANDKRLGLIAGNGDFPLLLLDIMRAQGAQVVVAAVKEETSPKIEERGAIAVHWMALGKLGKLIDTFQREGVTMAIMAGQVKRERIFSRIRPDWRMTRVLTKLKEFTAEALLGGIADELKENGIHLMDPRHYLEPLLAKEGTFTLREPIPSERESIDYGRRVGRQLVACDIGQTVVIAAKACVAVEAMEGTNATIHRAGELMKRLRDDSAPDDADKGSVLFSRNLIVVKVARANQDLRFDVPTVGIGTIEAMKEAGATCLAVDAGKCIFLNADETIRAADEASIAIVADAAP